MVNSHEFDCPMCGTVITSPSKNCPDCSFNVKKNWICDECGEVKYDYHEKISTSFGTTICSNCEDLFIISED